MNEINPNALDNYITGHHGEDQFEDEVPKHDNPRGLTHREQSIANRCVQQEDDTMPPSERVYRVWVHLADNEWSDLMDSIARNVLADPQFAKFQPLVVHVHEHGGWSLTYTMIDGALTVISSANDAAVFYGKAKAFRDRYFTVEWVNLADVRRRNDGSAQVTSLQ